MENNRKEIAVGRDIQIEEGQYAKGVTADQLIVAAKQMKEGEYVSEFTRRKGFHDVWGAGQDEPQGYHDYPVIVAVSFRPETDEEYFYRMQKEEEIKNDAEDKDRREYLRLKAKYETIQPPQP